MKYRKFQLLMSKYGFSLSIMLLELCLVFGLFLYLGRMAPILWVIVLIFMSMATIVAIVNRSMTPDSKVMWLVVTFVPVIGPLLYLMFGERRLSKKEIKQVSFDASNQRMIIGDDVKIYAINGSQMIIDDMDREASDRIVLSK